MGGGGGVGKEAHYIGPLFMNTPVFSVYLVCKEELNLLLKVSDFYSRCGGFRAKEVWHQNKDYLGGATC